MFKSSSAMSRLLAALLLYFVVGITIIAPLMVIPVAFVQSPWLSAAAAVLPIAGLAAGYLVASIEVVRDAVGLFRRGDSQTLSASTRLVKLAGVPAFTTSFLIVFFASAITLLISSMFAAGAITAAMIVVAVPIVVTVTYLTMLPTSAYGIALALLLRRQRRASTGFAVIHILLHLMFVVDILSTLLVAYRALPNPRPARMVGWLAAVVGMALLVPVCGQLMATPLYIASQREAQQQAAEIELMPGVLRVEGRAIELVPGVNLDQARAIAAKGYATQDLTGRTNRWTLRYGQVTHLLMGVRPGEAGIRALVLLGPEQWPEAELTVEWSQYLNDPGAVARVRADPARDTVGKVDIDTVSAIIEFLAAQPESEAIVGSVGAGEVVVAPGASRSTVTVEHLDAVAGLLSPQLTLDRLSLGVRGSRVTLMAHGTAEIAPICARGLDALSDLPDLELSVDARTLSEPVLC